ncbi:MAG: hypothetical protein CSA72_09515 [Rhodobacterales bacterium]|nr:MAG: hypothetical protein CSA72_09515 [Rhodobacterales bacterium]
MGRETYFATLDRALKDAGIVTPTLVIDRDRLDRNIDTVTGALPPGMGLRIVAKSLPSTPLLAHVMARAGTDRLMTFNLPMLRQIAAELPGAHQLWGKPLIEAAVKSYFDGERRNEDRITWLVDTAARLETYAAIARSAGATLDVALEIDVGLHRGGLRPGDALSVALATLSRLPELRFAGLMGYEPHLPSVPTLLGWRGRAQRAAWEAYRTAKQQVQDALGEDTLNGAILNTAGSPTYRLYGDTTLANEVSVGSALLKPTDFDTDLLKDHVPAAFIATPVIKGPMPAQLPVLGRTFIRRSRDQMVFIHGGHWMAEPEDPPLHYSATFGRSSNQEALLGAEIPVAPGDFVFLRPHQSEAVLLQFGPLTIVSDGKVVVHWPSFAVSA